MDFCSLNDLVKQNIYRPFFRFRHEVEQTNDYRVVVVGGAATGKSSLVLRFVRDTFNERHIPTVEDVYCQVVSCNKNSVCNLQIVDTTGSYQFPAMLRLNISKAHAFIMAYSVTSRQSLEELRPTWENILEIKGSMENVPLMLVGNKCDETDARELTAKEGEEQARQWSSHFMETSAKTNYKVKELFQGLLSLDKDRNMTIVQAESDRQRGSRHSLKHSSSEE
ncbi:hypothetical protein DAPPUDRAFT_63150 [Daphnia pulex]|uniref:GTP-binding protein Di-Ras2 n=1 Tax=Daphnia pulex TaxID=6669 RepID=E9HIN2_DAPPU|nr:hypothetical protein DAPPUDRAFT_63150 [Daphnia pulex]|eukprot:EFX68411.1 hypothetical protein DAPPUDRAFT_63150 [Daphnia pulex]